MNTKREWSNSTVTYSFNQGANAPQLQQRLTNVIAEPTDEQILQVGQALASLDDKASLTTADLTVHSQILAVV